VFALLRSALGTAITGQVRWRGRNYPVAPLRSAARAAERRDWAAARARNGRSRPAPVPPGARSDAYGDDPGAPGAGRRERERGAAN